MSNDEGNPNVQVTKRQLFIGRHGGGSASPEDDAKMIAAFTA